MGGMFTIIKVRDRLGQGDPGWYAHPAGTVAREATAAELAADGIAALPAAPSEAPR
jgi:manganese oxidase